ncbi:MULTISPECIES: SMR family transporter [Asticcacaulis]|uniref:SMR family transporter n=1 Tax=Asticcacaulis TaxID=76890 RepID=UPI001FD97227|nr:MULTISPECIES: SMR family transporter [Asticcacaulis]MBP2160438.1 small multidrug resistance pump [Asticcacaulis solisilvae]MDR6801483.1 small multidrug resistance pump [Asticcacaulis sp. BE141]
MLGHQAEPGTEIPAAFECFWSGVGIVVISVIGYLVYRQILDLPALLGIGLILTGTVVIKVFSKSVA